MHLLTRLCGIAVCATLAAPPVLPQHGGATATVTGHVSPVVAVSTALPALTEEGGTQISASNAGTHALVLLLSGTGSPARIDIPLRLRSNASFILAASCMTRDATLSDLSVVEVSAGGKFVYPGAAARVEIPTTFDGRPERPTLRPAGEDFSSPVTILSGPPVSMSGALDSPGNMIEIVLRVVLKVPDAGKRWHAKLQFSAEPRRER